MENDMKKVLASVYAVLLLAAMTFAQMAAPAEQPKADDQKMSCCHQSDKAKMADCCKDCPKDKDGKMACMKDGKCTADCPMMKDGMMACMQDGKMACMADGKMACMKDGKCSGADCPMKDGKMACMKEGKCTGDCPMMKKENKSKAEMKGCCSGNKCTMEKMHEHSGN